jgi:serine/threonine protein kinase
VWALGCLLYELLTLQVPFQAKSLRDLMQKILYSKPAAPNRSAYSSDFLQLVVQMLAKAAERRPTISDIILKPVITAHLEDFKSRYSAMYDDAGQGYVAVSASSISVITASALPQHLVIMLL